MQLNSSKDGIHFPTDPGLFYLEIFADRESSSDFDYSYFEVYGKDMKVNFTSWVTVEQEWNILEIDIRPNNDTQLHHNDLLVIEIPVRGLNYEY